MFCHTSTANHFWGTSENPFMPCTSPPLRSTYMAHVPLSPIWDSFQKASESPRRTMGFPVLGSKQKNRGCTFPLGYQQKWSPWTPDIYFSRTFGPVFRIGELNVAFTSSGLAQMGLLGFFPIIGPKCVPNILVSQTGGFLQFSGSSVRFLVFLFSIFWLVRFRWIAEWPKIISNLLGLFFWTSRQGSLFF